MKKKIALLACGWSTFFLQDFIKGIQQAIKDQNTDLYIFNAYNFTEFSGYPNSTGYSVYSLVKYEDYDGVIILSDLITNPRVLEKERLRILKAGIPVITINRQIQGMECLKMDNYSGFYELITHLIKEHQITDLGYIAGREQSLDIAERYKAFRTALLDNQIKINMDQVYTIEACNYNVAYGFINNLLNSGKSLPKAIVCANDLLALAVKKAAEEHNIKTPEDLRIIGYDDTFFSDYKGISLSTVKNDAVTVGKIAAQKVLGQIFQISLIKSQPVIRCSCGCQNESKTAHTQSVVKVINDNSRNEEFSQQMEVIEEIFTEAADVFTLLTNLESFFSKSHKFEGSDFCIFLKSDWASVLINSEERLPQNFSYGTQVQSIVSVQNDKKYLNEVVTTDKLIPTKMYSEQGSNTYMIIPIFNHSYVFGYIVTKNSLNLLENHYGYTWTRTFGNSIERFRRKNMYKQMSQQFLKLSTQDALSGLMNRVGMEKFAYPFYEQNKKNGLTTILFFVDINKMKTINDQFGHLHGDLAVKTVAAAISQVIPRNWLGIRYGGDEFLVLGNSKIYKGEDYCSMIKQVLERKTAIMSLPYKLSASVGTYQVPPTSPLTLEQAVEKVDEIMYVQKQQFHQTH